jgi:small subunit ribosomal protein S20
MPIKKSAIKDLKQTSKRAERNKLAKTRLRDLSRHFRIAIENKDKAKAESTIKDIIKAVDKAVQKNIIKKNTAARKKSRMMKKLNELK